MALKIRRVDKKYQQSGLSQICLETFWARYWPSIETCLACRIIRKAWLDMHDLIPVMTCSCAEGCFPRIPCPDVNQHYVGPAWCISWRTLVVLWQPGQAVTDSNNVLGRCSVHDNQYKVWVDHNENICTIFPCSNACWCSLKERGYNDLWGTMPCSGLILQSYSQCGGNPVAHGAAVTECQWCDAWVMLLPWMIFYLCVDCWLWVQ